VTTLLVDITDTMEIKLKAIACHVSQVGDLKSVEARMRTRAAALGKAEGHTYAEGFDHVLVPGCDGPDTQPVPATACAPC
jgi:LmbE family N-acetylglucosaminyl deacetylase